ncbi:hypothetical protein DFJ58DRAFT_734565 [Suillus subalutaceus]|uniref:uncharacterized protein n=1 Tax=Suillus subalutaceus TaxID=48586 RepID=UPI001B87B895|nr:uncharacterized protein DFJ58DRAFT_734565 [Suillus subalutaceus]KAG1837122.1 hypothetical protein DFJ58DRAFT_734565 [Suillus subalutaceus]
MHGVGLRESLREVLDRRDQTNVWLNGLASVGKTSVAFTVAEEMKELEGLPPLSFSRTSMHRLTPARTDFSRAFEAISRKGSRKTRFYYQTPYPIIIDALVEYLSLEEAARLATLFTETLSGPDLLTIHLICTSRPEARIRATMSPGVHQISLITRDADVVQDIRFFPRASYGQVVPPFSGDPKIFAIRG